MIHQEIRQLSLEQLRKKIAGRKVYIWGAGNQGLTEDPGEPVPADARRHLGEVLDAELDGARIVDERGRIQVRASS